MQIERNIVGPEALLSSLGHRRHELEARATAQHGVVSRRQLIAIGFTADEIRGMLDSRRLLTIHRGVYAAGHRRLTQRARWMAAVLACGAGALLSHRCAGALRNLRRASIGYSEVTPATRRRGVQGIRTYCSTQLQPQDRDEIDGIPCTSTALTLLQLAAILPRRDVERACDEADVQELFDLIAINDVLTRFRGCRGAAKLRAVLDHHAIGTTLTRPGLEEKTLVLCDDAAIPRPHVNVRVLCRPGIDWEVDFLWRTQRLVLETDGGRLHHTHGQIQRDRRKEADLVRAGYHVLRATWFQIQYDPHSVTLMLQAALADRTRHRGS